MPIPILTSSSTTLMQAFLGVGVVLAALLFLVGVCSANAWIVRLVHRFDASGSPLSNLPSPAAAPPAQAASDIPDHLLLILAAAAAHVLEEDIERIVIVDVQPFSHWKLEGRLAIHRNRLTSKAVHAPAFPSGGNSP